MSKYKTKEKIEKRLKLLENEIWQMELKILNVDSEIR